MSKKITQKTGLDARCKDFTRDVIKVKVSFSLFPGEVPSPKVAHIAAQAEAADEDLIKGSVVIIPRDKFKATRAAKNQMVALWKKGNGKGLSGTRPWEDGGWRLALVSEYATLRTELEQLARNYRDAVRQEIDRSYDDLKATAESKLNGLLGDGFLAKDVLLSKYDVRIYTDRLASMDDVRFTGLSDDEAQALVADRDAYYNQLIISTNTDLLGDIAKAITILIERLEDEKSTFQGTPETGFPVIENVLSMLARCEKFNITGDAKIAATISKLRDQIQAIDMTKAKQDTQARRTAAKAAKQAHKDLRTVMDDLCKM